MTTLPKAIYRLSEVPIKLPMALFKELEQKVLQFVWKHKGPWIAKAIPLNLKNYTFYHHFYLTFINQYIPISYVSLNN